MQHIFTNERGQNENRKKNTPAKKRKEYDT